MASSSSSPPPPQSNVTQEEFELFHSIDRQLFVRLIAGIGRNPGESIQVMALWIWLERAGYNIRIVKDMLSLPNTIVNALADEAVACLNCIEQDNFPLPGSESVDTSIPLIQSMTKSGVTLRFFHENRLSIIRGVATIVNEVCVRAFKDILERLPVEQRNFPNDGATGQAVPPPNFYAVPLYASPRVGAFSHPHMVGSGGTGTGSNLAPQVFQINYPGGGGMADPRMMFGVNAPILGALQPYDLAVQRQILNAQLSDMLANVTLNEEEANREVPEDDRTIFLTFSKGYPISEAEVKEFFTREFGDIIEAIFMQDVEHEEQALYARLVVRSLPSIEVVLGGQRKAKFCINGKHVWARKYVPKHPKSPPQSTTPTSSKPTSPVARK